MAFGGRGGGGRGGADCGGVGDVDAGVPEAVAELPNLELEGVGKRSELSQLCHALPDIGGGGPRRGFIGGVRFE